ncbi:MAG TPA: hypothetical protein VGQ46_14475 [Thermoanaerobaculia bacterium]|jgi:hypothetical protein|nr:hypothetical protein [Thermoanaerobaculia bacterium]
MRVCRTLLVFALLLSGCATAGGERVHVVVFNESGLTPRLQISVDGERVLDELPAITTMEPSIVSTTYLRLRAGSHRIVVMRDNIEHSLTFDVRAGTRTDVRVHVQQNEIVLDVGYGERLYI